jgi:hypothetical protein
MWLSLAIWLQNIKLFQWIRDADRGYQITLSLHLTCISLFAAMIVMTDLRLLGWGMRGVSISDIVRQTRVPKRIGFPGEAVAFRTGSRACPGVSTERIQQRG